jgi:hypothetical protein
MVEKYLKRAGITKKISCHVLHYTCATKRAALGMIAFCLRAPLSPLLSSWESSMK